MIKITFLDGNIRECETNTTLHEIAKSISTSLAKKCVCGLIDGQFADLEQIIDKDCKVQLLTQDDEQQFIEVLNHSTAHIMALAVKRLYPDAKFGVGPFIDEGRGFYYDIDTNQTINEETLPKIEKEMKKIVSNAFDFKKDTITYQQAKEIFKNDQYKLHLIEKINDKNEEISSYTIGEFVDLCRGTHISNTKWAKNFKLLNVAGAYWLGDSNNKMLQRVYGTSWIKKDSLDSYLKILQNRKDSDHRKIGKELEIFTFTQQTGAGLPLWLPNGAVIRYQLEKFIKEEELRRGYDHVYTPVLGTKQLYETSGHWDHYQEDMFKPIEMDNETFVLRPMCCPHHAMIYKHTPKSYKDLPIKIAELGGMHRYEASGALTGLERVRNMCLNDAHLFVRPDQIKEEFSKVIDLVMHAVEVLDLDVSYYRLSLRDPNNKEKYYDDNQMWNQAEQMLREALNNSNIDYQEALDEAAFYGPKLDIQIKTALGHDITLSTIQLDFLLPERFDLTYIGQDGEKHRPVIIHRGIISTMERMTATLLEQYKGAFPLWLSPTQVNIIPVNISLHQEYADKIFDSLRLKDVRVTIDNRDEKFGKKIREAQIAKIPYSIIIGDSELENNTITIREYRNEQNYTHTLLEFEEKILKEIQTKFIKLKKDSIK